ncbi:hypothetical protein EJ377_04250 [Chryseobacterium arthrosphaerae]|uniref:Uncharacterized protein n=1 Tax=Chryseobacterium arthrosphaerae TaxID=651561 RepID=A0A432DZH0_9FLAO|nr:hypothetical protein EJ377_04250 [Chryseobacterium arthrosphaerae]
MENPVEPQYEIKLEIDPLKDEHGLIRIDGTEPCMTKDLLMIYKRCSLSMLISDDPVINRR